MHRSLLKNLLADRICMFCLHGKLDLIPVANEAEAKLNNWQCFSSTTITGADQWAPGAMYRQALRCHCLETMKREVRKNHTCSNWEPRKKDG